MIPPPLFFMAGLIIGIAWGWSIGREYPYGPQGRV